MDNELGFGARLWLWLVVPWKVLFDGAFAARVRAVMAGDAPALTVAAADAAPEPILVPEVVGTDPTTALQLLGLLQREGRFVDFLQEDVSDFSDADIGAAARVVHAGCKRALAEAVQIRPIRSEVEGDPVELPEGFDALRVRLTGNVAGQPPYRGRLAHHGWEVADITFPTVAGGHDPRVVAPAEVEL